MTHAEIVRRGKLSLLVCLATLVGAMAAYDWSWGAIMSLDRGFALALYGLILGLGAAALRGAAWARYLLASLVGGGVIYSIFLVARIGFVIPVLSGWIAAHALLNAVIAWVLLLSPSIARYQSSRSRLVMP